MKLDIQQVVKHQHVYPDPRGRYRDWVHDTHVIAFHQKVAGRCVAGREACELKPPYLEVLATGERDGNGMHGRDEGYWCLFTGDLVARVPGGQAGPYNREISGSPAVTSAG